MTKSICLTVVEPNSQGGLIHYAYQFCTAIAGEGVSVQLITGSKYELAGYPHNFQVHNFLNLWQLFDPHSMEDPPSSRFLRRLRKIRWTFRRGLRAFRLVREWVRLTRFLIHSRPDIVQFGKINFPFEAFFLRYLKTRGLQLTQICHEFERRESSGSYSAFIDRTYASVFENFSLIFFHAQENRDRFLRLFSFYPPNQTAIIPHGNEGLFLQIARENGQKRNLRGAYGFEDDDKVIMFFGILSPSKGIEDLIDAFAIIKEPYRVKLLIAGYPTKHMDILQLKNRVSTHNISDLITFDTRYIPNEEVGALMDLASVVVFPYRSSTQSGALQVAFSFGKPVIVTRVGGLPEVVEDGKNGLIVPPQNPQALSEKIQLVLSNKDLADQLGANAKKISETKYGWRPIAQKVLGLYREMLDTRTN